MTDEQIRKAVRNASELIQADLICVLDSVGPGSEYINNACQVVVDRLKELTRELCELNAHQTQVPL